MTILAVYFQGIEIPLIVKHGTTIPFIDAYTQPDGSYNVPYPFAIWATRGDSRAWPKDPTSYKERRATIIISALKAYSGIVDAIPHSSVRFSHLPPNSFRVLRESECSFKLENPEYQRRISRLERELLEEPK